MMPRHGQASKRPMPTQDDARFNVPTTSIHRVEADGVQVFYRAAGEANAPVVLLLHGFPTSSFMFRELIPRLANDYRVIAPDLPGFGFTEVPPNKNIRIPSIDWRSRSTPSRRHSRSSAMQSMCSTMAHQPAFVWRWRTQSGSRPLFRRMGTHTKKALVKLGVRSESIGPHPRQRIGTYSAKAILTAGGTRWQYTHGVANPESVPPESYTLDTALLERPGNKEIQLDLFLDYASNVKLYPKFQEYFRKSKPPLLAIWGKNDPFFIPAGAEAFRKDIPSAKFSSLTPDTSRLEHTSSEIASAMKDFLQANGISRAAEKAGFKR